MRRIPLVLASLVLPAFSSAALIQVWNKVYSVNGFPTTFTDVAFDNAGNVYALGTVSGADKDAVIIKINTAGSTVWTNRLVLPDDQRGGHIVFGGSDSVYVTYSTGAGGAGLALRKIKLIDGGTLGTLSFDDPTMFERDNGALLRDPSGQVLYTFEKQQGLFARYQTVVKIDATTLSASGTKTMLLPTGHRFIDAEGSPAGGLLMLFGTNVEGKYFDSDLYLFNSATSVITSSPSGLTSQVVVNPADNTVFAVGGGSASGQVNLAKLPLGGELLAGTTFNTPFTAAFIRGSIMTRKRNVIAVGGTDQDAGDFSNSFLTSTASSTLSSHYMKAFAGTAGDDWIQSLRLDGFFGLSAVEVNDSFTNSRILELDEDTGNLVHSRTYPYLISCHAVSADGLIAMAGDAGTVTLVRPRDLRDITLPLSSYSGGSQPTLTVNAYQTYALSRSIALSDDSSHVTMPSTVTIGIGATTATALVTTTAVVAGETVTLKATYGTQSRTFTFNLIP